MLTLKPYKDILKMAKEQVDALLVPVRTMRARKQAELEVAKLDEQLASQEAQVHELCAVKELNFHAIIQAQDTYALTERRRKQFIRIIQEMFPG